MNTNEQTVWKVVRQSDNEYRSVISYNYSFSIDYKLNEFVKPSLSTSKIFCFRTRQQARVFKRDNMSLSDSQHSVIFKAIAKNVTKASIRASTWCFSNEIAKFWKHNSPVKGVSVPDGTLFCDELMLIEKIR